MKQIYTMLLATVLVALGNLSAHADEAHPWAGTFTLKCADDAPYIYYTDYETGEDKYSCIKYGYEPKAEFNVTITWTEEEGYKLTNIYGYECDANGGYSISVTDEKHALVILPEDRDVYFHTFDTIPADTTITILEDGTKDTTIVAAVTVGLKLWDGSNSFPGFEPIELYMNSDGQISMGGFKVIWVSPQGQNVPSTWFSECVPLNGGDEPEEVVAHDWTGIYRMDVAYDMNMPMDGNEYPTSGIFQVADDGFGNYVVTQFLSYDTQAANALSGGIYITQSQKKSNTATIDCSSYMNFIQPDETGFAGMVLLDAVGSNGGIEIKYDEATNTINMDYFYFGQFDGASNELTCAYFGATCTPVTAEEAQAVTSIRTAAPTAKQIYSVGGARLAAPQKGINIIREVIGGKVITRKQIIR